MKSISMMRYRVKRIIDLLFKEETVAVQAQMLKSLLTSRKLKEATTLLGIRKSTKDKESEGKCDTK